MGWVSGAWAAGAWNGTAWAVQDALVAVPDVVGDTQTDDTLELEGDGFVVAVQTENDSAPIGTIIRQSPVGGTQANSGSTVTITVSLGPKASDGAGRKRRRYYVEIDGEQFDVADANEAQTLLARARALAEQAAEETAKAVVSKRKPETKVRKVTILPPRVTASPELELDLAPIKRDLARIYTDAAALAELQLLLRRAQDEDDEETLFLLM